MTGLAYGAAAALILAMPRSGSSTRGRRAVAAIGTASVTHQRPIHTPTAAVRHADGDIPPIGPASNMIAAATGPIAKEMGRTTERSGGARVGELTGKK